MKRLRGFGIWLHWQAVLLFAASSILQARTAPASLPIEVIGPDGFERSVSVTAAEPGRGPNRLWLEVNGLEYDHEAEVRLNRGSWLPITNATVAVESPARELGGIGGAADTLRLTIVLPVDSVVAGPNTVQFRFTGTDGISSGYRVLAFNLLDGRGNRLVSDAAFAEEDPSTWTAPRPAPEDVEQGRLLWNRAALVVPVPGEDPRPIRAHCGDCHTSDGRDLAYFNFSNQAIIARSGFHGLNPIEGERIASYIRQLAVPRPGRPWNPPYQPGPGLDAKPVEDWAAGAGLQSVARSDRDMLLLLAAGNGRVNIREMPVTLQLPDWNHWLPRVHPLDAYGATFADSGFFAGYRGIREGLSSGVPEAYFNQRFNWQQWSVAFYNDLSFRVTPKTWTATSAEQVYSLALWRQVKEWELMSTFRLEGSARSILGPRAEPRAWISEWPFHVSPNMLHIAKGGALRRFSDASYIYVQMTWYEMQMILNGGNGRQEGPSPVDWPYVSGVVKDLNWTAKVPEAGLQLLVLTYGLQMAALQPAGPEGGERGWIPGMSDPSRLVHPAWEGNWSATPAALRTTLTEAHLRRWWLAVKDIGQAQWIQGGWVKDRETITPNRTDGSFGERIYYMLPRMRSIGVDPALLDQIAVWAANIWPQADWKAGGVFQTQLPVDFLRR